MGSLPSRELVGKHIAPSAVPGCGAGAGGDGGAQKALAGVGGKYMWEMWSQRRAGAGSHPPMAPWGATSPGQAQAPTLALGRGLWDRWAQAGGACRSWHPPNHPALQQGRVGNSLPKQLRNPGWPWKQGPRGRRRPHAVGGIMVSQDTRPFSWAWPQVWAAATGVSGSAAPSLAGGILGGFTPQPEGLVVRELVGPSMGSAFSPVTCHGALEMGRGGDAYSRCCKKPSPLQEPSPLH